MQMQVHQGKLNIEKAIFSVLFRRALRFYYSLVSGSIKQYQLSQVEYSIMHMLLFIMIWIVNEHRWENAEYEIVSKQ